MKGAARESDDGPVDMVFTYVNGTDPAHIEKRHRFEPLYPETEIRRNTPADRNPEARHVDVGEIAFSVNSVVKYLPWVRTIYIVTDSQVPPVSRDLIECGRVRIVDHQELIPGRYLPTFNSLVIESCLHRIPGISEIFLYNNDDCMHFSPVPRSVFYTVGADGRILLDLRVNFAVRRRLSYRIAQALPVWQRKVNLHAIAISNAFALLRAGPGRVPFYAVIAPRHVTQVFRKSTAERLETEFGAALDRNRQLRFRSSRSFSYTTLLYTMEKRWNQDDNILYPRMLPPPGEQGLFDFTGVTHPGRMARLWRAVAASRERFACLNSIPWNERDTFAGVMRLKGLGETGREPAAASPTVAGGSSR